MNMKRIAVFIAVVALCGMVSGSAARQRSELANKESLEHVRQLGSLFMFIEPGIPSQYPRYSWSRAEVAVFTNQIMHMVEASLYPDFKSEIRERLNDGTYRGRVSEDFWRIEFLMRGFDRELAGIGVDLEEMWASFARVKKGFAELGLKLRNPYNERFSDVPDGHWADDAIHNMRRAGILYGYPDGTFRGN